MPPVQFSCGGCHRKLLTSDFLKCNICSKKYDIECASVPIQHFKNAMTRDEKSQWVCHECMSKLPKTNNANTPVRSIQNISTDNLAQSTQSDTTRENVTIRRPVPKAVSTPTSDGQILNKELLPIKTELQEFRASLDFFNNKYEEIKNDMSGLVKENYELSRDSLKLKSTVEELSYRLNNTEQYLRDNNLEFHGVPKHHNENLRSLLIQCASVIGLRPKDDDITNCVRVAKLNKDNKMARSITVKFRNVECVRI
ncbi:hypothetical protein ACJJTC_015514 [Scirpophaga incertulas]